MSFPDAFAHDIVLGPDQVLPTVPRDFGERFTLNWKAARAPDKSYFYETRMSELWDDALDQLQKATGQTFANPFTLAPAQSVSKLSPAGVVIDTLQRTLFGDRQKGIDAALKAFDQAREGQFDLPDPRRFEDRVRAESVKLRQDAEKSALASYGAGGLGAFLGAAAGELSHPVNIATLPLGGEYAIANVARMGLLKFLGRNALVEGGVAAVSQTAIEAMDAPIQERLATDTGIGDRVERVLTAGVGGAILGLGLSGLVAAVRGARFRGRMALDEADALKVAERNVYAAERNPLGPDGINAHAKALDTAEVQVSAGRHANVDEIVREEVRRQVPPVHERTDVSPLTERLPDDLPQQGLVVTKDVGQDRYTLFADGEKVGFAEIRPESNSVQAINIASEHRRKGYATQLMRAIEADLGVRVPAAGIITPDGHKFFPAYEARRDIPADVRFAGPYREGFENARRGGTRGDDPYSRIAATETPFSWDNTLDAGRSNWQAMSRDWQRGFDLLDSAAATRPIADAAPVPPEKPPTGMKEAKADEARAMVLQKDFEITMEDGTKRMASEIMAEADERLKAAKLAAECAAGGAIG